MKNRIKELRKFFDVTQEKFAERIGSTQNVIASYESGRRKPSNAVINNICKEFNVNEEWLRTGNGEMFKEEKYYSLDEFLQEQEATELEIEIVKLLFSLKKETREELIARLKEVFQPENIDQQKEKTLEQEADEFAELARQQYLQEKRRAQQASSAKKSEGA